MIELSDLSIQIKDFTTKEDMNKEERRRLMRKLKSLGMTVDSRLASQPCTVSKISDGETRFSNNIKSLDISLFKKVSIHLKRWSQHKNHGTKK